MGLKYVEQPVIWPIVCCADGPLALSLLEKKQKSKQTKNVFVVKFKKKKEKLNCPLELLSVLPINAFFIFLTSLFVAKPTLKHIHRCWATCLDTNTGLNRKGEAVGHTITALNEISEEHHLRSIFSLMW